MQKRLKKTKNIKKDIDNKKIVIENSLLFVFLSV